MHCSLDRLATTRLAKCLQTNNQHLVAHIKHQLQYQHQHQQSKQQQSRSYQLQFIHQSPKPASFTRFIATATHLSRPLRSQAQQYHHMELSDTAKHVLDSNRQYFIEYDGFLSNHLSHAAVALDKLHAPPQVIEKFCNFYAKRLEKQELPSPSQQSQQSQQTNQSVHESKHQQVYQLIDHLHWRQFLGQKPYYTSYLNYFDREIESQVKQNGAEAWKAVVSSYAPTLLAGAIGGAFHGLIHLGLGVEACHPGMIAEGLAYLAILYLPLPQSVPSKSDQKSQQSSSTLPKLSPLEALKWVVKEAQNTSLPQRVMEERIKEPYASIHLSKFQVGVRVLIDQLHSLAPKLFEFQLDVRSDNLAAVIRSISEMVAFIYFHSGNDFFFLHGNTSWRSLKVCLPLLPRQEDQIIAISTWFNAFALALIVEDLRGVDLSLPAITVFFESHASRALSTPTAPTTKVTDADWHAVIQECFKSEDEHTFKVVYTLLADWREYDQAEIFYKAALKAAMDKDAFVFTS